MPGSATNVDVGVEPDRLTAGPDDADQQQFHHLLGRVASNLAEAEAGKL